MENLARCTICLDIFRDPRNLKCGHTYCKDCIIKLLSSNKNNEKNIHCPQCRQYSKYQDEFPKNFEILSIVESLQNSKLSSSFSSLKLNDPPLINSSKQLICEDCQEQTAEIYCSTCKVFFCVTCHSATHKTRLFQAHKTLAAKQAQQFALFKCKNHDNEKVEFWCYDCDELFCSICSSHQSHSTSNILTALSQLKSQFADPATTPLTEYQLIIQQLKTCYSTQNLFFSEIATQIEADQMKIVEYFQKLRKLIDEKEKELIAEIPTFYPGYCDGMKNVNYMKDKFLEYQSLHDQLIESLQLPSLNNNNNNNNNHIPSSDKRDKKKNRRKIKENNGEEIENIEINLLRVKSRIKADIKEATELINSKLPSYSAINVSNIPDISQAFQRLLQSINLAPVIIKDNNYNLQKPSINCNNIPLNIPDSNFRINQIDNEQLKTILAQANNQQPTNVVSPISIKNDYVKLNSHEPQISYIYQQSAEVPLQQVRFSSEFKAMTVDVSLDCQTAINQSRSEFNFIFSQKPLQGDFAQWRIRIDRITSRLFIGISANCIKDNFAENSNVSASYSARGGGYNSTFAPPSAPITNLSSGLSVNNNYTFTNIQNSNSFQSNLNKPGGYNPSSNKGILDRINAPSNLASFDVRYKNQTITDKSNYGITESKQVTAGEFLCYNRPLPSPTFSSGNELLLQFNRSDATFTIQNLSKAWTYVIKDIPLFQNGDMIVEYYFHSILYDICDQISLY